MMGRSIAFEETPQGGKGALKIVSARLEDGSMLNTGDAARISGSDGQRLTAGPDGAEVLIWEMHATIAA